MANLVLVSNTVMDKLHQQHPDIEGTPKCQAEDGRVWPKKDSAAPKATYPPDPLLPKSRLQALKRILG